jgi:hypothetical protein
MGCGLRRTGSGTLRGGGARRRAPSSAHCPDPRLRAGRARHRGGDPPSVCRRRRCWARKKSRRSGRFPGRRAGGRRLPHGRARPRCGRLCRQGRRLGEARPASRRRRRDPLAARAHVDSGSRCPANPSARRSRPVGSAGARVARRGPARRDHPRPPSRFVPARSGLTAGAEKSSPSGASALHGHDGPRPGPRRQGSRKNLPPAGGHLRSCAVSCPETA